MKHKQTKTPNLSFVAIQAALEAGDLLRKGFNTHYRIEHKPGKHNLVTTYDKKAEKLIIERIQHVFPTHAFLAEESGQTKANNAPVTWIIDPLDGTVNFAHHIPVFSISIAAAIQKDIICGVVYQPMTQELFIAEKGQGAYLNGQRLQVSKTRSLNQSILATGFPYNVDENPRGCLDHFVSISRKGIPVRRLGSAAIDLAYVAAGRFDAFWEVSLHPWDMAAGKLLVEEAGGKVTHYDGSSHRLFCEDTLLASNGLLHTQMVNELC